MSRVVMTTSLLAALLWGATPGHASTIQVNGAGIDPNAHETAVIQIGAGPSETVYAGQILLDTQVSGVLPVWCTDIFHTLLTGGTTYFTSAPLAVDGGGGALSGVQAREVGWLISNFTQHVDTTDNFSGPAPAGYGSVNQLAAATQLAIWAVENPAGFAFDTSGTDPSLQGPTGKVAILDASAFTAVTVGGFIVDTEEWVPSNPDGSPLTCLPGSSCTNGWNDQGLGFIGLGGIIVVSTPEPASMTLLAASLVAGAALRRKRRG